MMIEPGWWADARSMRHLGPSAVARHLGKSRSAVYYALRDQSREAERARKSAERHIGGCERSGVPYTPEELERAIELHERHGLTWDVVAVRMGRSLASIKVNVCRYRKGRKFELPIRARESEEMAEMAFNGLSLGEIARRRGCHPSNVWQRLNRIGVDQEVIQEMRAERSLAA